MCTIQTVVKQTVCSSVSEHHIVDSVATFTIDNPAFEISPNRPKCRNVTTSQAKQSMITRTGQRTNPGQSRWTQNDRQVPWRIPARVRRLIRIRMVCRRLQMSWMFPVRKTANVTKRPGAKVAIVTIASHSLCHVRREIPIPSWGY